MADTGWKFPGTAVGNRPVAGAGENWASPDNIKADDGSDASVMGFEPWRSYGLAATNFDFSGIPGGSTIDGIEVRVGDYSDDGGTVWGVCKLILADDSDGSVSKHADLATPGSLQTDEAGGSVDLWSETIGLSDVQDSDWGFFVTGEGNLFETLSVDFMQMKVYYTEHLNTGWKFPGTAVADRPISGGVTWYLPDNIKADDSSDTQFFSGEGAPNRVSLGLAATNFDFSSIPSGSTIDGIEIRCGGYSQNIADFTWTTVKLILADDSDGSVSKHADLLEPTSTPQTDEAGGTTDLWTETINLTDVQDADWGFFVGLSDAFGDRIFDIDYMQMRVFYTEHLNTGWKFPGTAVGDRPISGGTQAWTNPNNVTVDDTSTAAWFSEDGVSLGLAATNFDFSSIPAGATIDGIEVRVGDYDSPSTSALGWSECRLILADDSDGTENKEAELIDPPGASTDEVGGYDDLWSEGTITRADVQDSDWGFFLGGTPSGHDRSIVIDFMQMRVFYTEAEGEEAALTTVLNTGEVGTLDKIITLDITGLVGTAAGGNLDKASLIALTSVIGTTAVDILVALIGASEQEGFRWRNDDGTEITATWRQAQDVDEDVAKEKNIRLRVLIDSTGNLTTQQATLQYKRDDEAASEWRDV